MSRTTGGIADRVRRTDSDEHNKRDVDKRTKVTRLSNYAVPEEDGRGLYACSGARLHLSLVFYWDRGSATPGVVIAGNAAC